MRRWKLGLLLTLFLALLLAAQGCAGTLAQPEVEVQGRSCKAPYGDAEAGRLVGGEVDGQ